MNEQFKRMGQAMVIGKTDYTYARARQEYLVRFVAYGLPTEKADSVVGYIEDRFAPSSTDILAALDNIQKGLSSGLYNASNINTIYTASDELLLGNAVALAFVVNRHDSLFRLQALMIEAARVELAMRLDKFLPFNLASFVANRCPKRWLNIHL